MSQKLRAVQYRLDRRRFGLAVRASQERSLRRPSRPGLDLRHLVVRRRDDPGRRRTGWTRYIARPTVGGRLDDRFHHCTCRVHRGHHLSYHDTSIAGPRAKCRRSPLTPCRCNRRHLLCGLPRPSASRSSRLCRCLDRVERGSSRQVDALVYDRPLLSWIVRQDFPALQVLGVTFDHQNYAIALPPNSSLRLPLDTAVLESVTSDWWEQTLYRYLGRGGGSNDRQ